MDVVLVYQVNVLHCAVIARQQLDVILLYDGGLFHDAIVAVGYLVGKERLPFSIGKLIVVQAFKLAAQVVNEFPFRLEWQIIIALFFKLADEVLFHLRLTLVLRGFTIYRLKV